MTDEQKEDEELQAWANSLSPEKRRLYIQILERWEEFKTAKAQSDQSKQ